MAMPMHWNWTETGGSFGRVRRLPGFTIRQNEKTALFYVTRDDGGETVSVGHASPDDAERSNAFRKPRPLA